VRNINIKTPSSDLKTPIGRLSEERPGLYYGFDFVHQGSAAAIPFCCCCGTITNEFLC